MLLYFKSASAASTHRLLQFLHFLLQLLLCVLLVHKFEEMGVLVLDVCLLIGHLSFQQQIA